MRLFIAFVTIPFVEMYLLIRIGAELGAITTILIVLLTATIGASLTRLEGWRTLRKIQAALAQGDLPASEMIDGLLIFAAGLVLITPGFLTDLLGFLLLIPTTRRIFKRWLGRRFQEMVVHGEGSPRVIITRFDDP